MTTATDEVAALEAEVAAAQAVLDDASRRLHDARVAAAEFKVGDVVIVQRHGVGDVKARVSRVGVSYGKVKYTVQWEAKNGGFQNAEHEVWGAIRRAE